MTTTDDRPKSDSQQDQKSGGKTAAQWIAVLVVLLVGLALIFGYYRSNQTQPTQSARTGAPGTAQSAAPGAPGHVVDPPPPAGAPGPLAASTPLAVSVPSIGANSSLIATGLRADGSLDVPPVSQPMQASWYNQSPTPGAKGPAVILGHINGDGHPGIFNKLDKVKQGDQIFVDRADHQRAVFTVSHIDIVPKASFPTGAVYNDTPNSQLRLITCGGDYDAAHRNYLSNVIVYADLSGVQPM